MASQVPGNGRWRGAQSLGPWDMLTELRPPLTPCLVKGSPQIAFVPVSEDMPAQAPECVVQIYQKHLWQLGRTSACGLPRGQCSTQTSRLGPTTRALWPSRERAKVQPQLAGRPQLQNVFIGRFPLCGGQHPFTHILLPFISPNPSKALHGNASSALISKSILTCPEKCMKLNYGA